MRDAAFFSANLYTDILYMAFIMEFWHHKYYFYYYFCSLKSWLYFVIGSFCDEEAFNEDI